MNIHTRYIDRSKTPNEHVRRTGPKGAFNSQSRQIDRGNIVPIATSWLPQAQGGSAGSATQQRVEEKFPKEVFLSFFHENLAPK